MTPAVQDWIRENLARATPLSVRQLDTIKAQFRKVTLPDRHAA